MANSIKYRTYKPGDEIGLAEIFNRAFQSLGGNFLRTSKSILWRYVHAPDSDSNAIQIAEDVTTHQIIGAIYSTIETYCFGGKSYRVGAINDVSTLPGYTKQGIAKKLMDQAVQYMKTQQCAYSVLCADPNGHPRAKIYIKAGYQDYIRQTIGFRIINPIIFFRFLPIILPFLPALILDAWIWQIFARFHRKSLEHQLYQIQIIYPSNGKKRSVFKSTEIRDFINRIGTTQFDGFAPYTDQIWQYFRNDCPYTSLKPTFVILKNGHKVIACAYFLRQYFYSSRIGIRVPIAFPREIFVDHTVSKDPAVIAKIYQVLWEQLCIAASRRRCAVLVHSTTPQNHLLIHAMKVMRFPIFPGGIFMIKSFNTTNSIPSVSIKPFHIPASENFGYP
jgi:ribosomal protein S18 acetylase RimI-like enzyme